MNGERKMICYHHNDLDGRCGAAIVLKKYPECSMREIDYKDDPDFSKEVELEEEVFIVDFSFTPEKMDELLTITGEESITWIDHHETVKDYKYECLPIEMKDGIKERWAIEFKGLRDFSQECKKSGCELTWEYLFPSEPTPEAVRLIGDYDCWRFDTREETINFQFGMRSEHTDPRSVVWRAVFDGGNTLSRVQDTGKAVVNYKTNTSRKIMQNGYNIAFEGHTCFVVNTPGIDSGMFDLHESKEEYGFFISWVYLGHQYRVSLKSINQINVAKIAQKYDGGGHKGAAGFVCDKLPWEERG